MVYYVCISLKEGEFMATKAAISSKKKSTTAKKVTASTKSVTEIYQSVRESINSMPLIGKLVAEFIGAFLLTVAFIEMQGNPLFVGFALAGIVLIIGGVSGAQLNPAVTVGSWFTRKIDWVHALGYIVVQVLGSVVAYSILNAFLSANASTATLGAAPTLFNAAEIVKNKEWYLFFAELFGSTILVLGLAAATRNKKNKLVASFTAGFSLLVALYVAMSLTTVLLTGNGETFTFLNPAIAFAANGLEWKTWPLVIYVLAPVLGGIIGFVLQDFLHSQGSDDCNCELHK